MRTFNASLSTGGLWLAVLIPPVVFFSLVQIVANGLDRGYLGLGGVFLLIAGAQLIPLLALVWILFSTAGYSVLPNKLVIHRVVSDREISLTNLREPPRLAHGVITLRLPRPLRLRVDEPERCRDQLAAALTPQGHSDQTVA